MCLAVLILEMNAGSLMGMRARMVNNAGIDDTETAGKIHGMTEETFDPTMYSYSSLSLFPPLSSFLRSSTRSLTCCAKSSSAVHTESVFLGCKYAAAKFLAQPLHQPSNHRGWIIITASIDGLVGFRTGAAAYCASKGAVVLLTKQVAVEYGTERTHCNALCPGCRFPLVSYP